MMPMKHNFCLVAAVMVFTSSFVARGQSNEPKVGDQPPALELKVLLQAPEGTKATWGALKGKVVVLEFWATWCGPCIAAISHLNELADQFKNQPVQFIAVTDEDEQIVSQFLKKKPIRAWVGLDTDKSMFKSYGITGIPHTVVVNEKGKIVAITHPSRLTDQVLNDILTGKELALVDSPQESSAGVRPGEVPYGLDNEKSNLFQVLIRPTAAGAGVHNTFSTWGNGSLTFCRMSVFEALSRCYGIGSVRIMTNSSFPSGKFDFVVKTPSIKEDIAMNWLRQALETTFELDIKRPTKAMDVYVLNVADSNTHGLVPTASTGGSNSSDEPGQMGAINKTIGSLAGDLEAKLGKPVIDETGLTNHYDYDLTWTGAEEIPQPGVLVRAVREQLGLALTAARRPVEVLVVGSLPK